MVSVIIVAAGNSSRMGGINKQLEKIADTPVFIMSALKFNKLDKVGEIIIVAPEDEKSRYEKFAVNFGISKLTAIVAGGDTRFKSVKNALGEISPKADYIAIHDGARPLIDKEDIERVFADAEKYNAAIAAVPATDTVKTVASNGFVESTIPREKLYYAQTPQVFQKKLYLSCLEKIGSQAEQITDDSSILELAGEYVKVTEVKNTNLKITHPDDLIAAQAIYDNRHTVKII